jgi:cytoskeletal protein CcmA (bactofilin family)
MAKNTNQLTHLSSLTTITGEIFVENDIRVAGKIKGKIETTGHLIVESTGDIEAQVTVESATIAGKITGNVLAKEKLILEAKAILTGDIQTKQLIIEDGAIFQGNCQMTGTGTPAKNSGLADKL